MRKKLLSWFLTVAMMLSLFAAMPMTANAEDVTYDGEFNIETGEGTGSGFRYASGELWLDEDGTYLVYGNGNKVGNRIRVNTSVTATVTIKDINLEINLPFECGDNSNVTLVLADNSENTFSGYGGHAGLRVVPTATLTITTAGQSLGNGSLSAYGGADSSSSWASAGIGGSELESSGTIVIDGGTIFAKGGNGRPPGAWRGPGGAGIGGASGRACGDITINGGTVTAIGGDVNPEGAGIGGGSSDPSTYRGKITINGGTVRAYSGQTGASGTGIGFCSSIAIADTADVEAYSSGNFPAIYGTTDTSGHTAFLLNLMLDSTVTADTDITITRRYTSSETFELTIPNGYRNFATTVDASNDDYTAALSDGSKKIVSLANGDTDFTGICDVPSTALSFVNVKLKANPVCVIGSTEYESLGEALTAATDGQTIKLLTDIDYTGSVVITNKSITFDLNGYTLEIQSDTIEGSKALEVGIGGKVSLEGEGALNVYCNGFRGSGVYAHSGGQVTVTNAESSIYMSDAAYAISGGIIEITDNVSGTYATVGSNQYCRAAYAEGDGSQVIIGGNATSANSNSVYAFNSAYIKVGGDVSGFYRGVDAGLNSTIIVDGNVTSSNAESAYAYDGSTITVGGDAISGGNNGYGAYAVQPGSSVTVAGNAIARGNFGAGALAGYGATVTIDGNAVSEGDEGYGVYAVGTAAVINVSGNVSAENGIGVFCYEGGTVTVEGAITAINYIKLTLSGVDDMMDETEGEVRDDYRIFTDGTNTVQVKLADTTAPVLTASSVNRISDTEATVKFTSDEAGQYYYEVVPVGLQEPDIDTSSSGTACDTGEQTIFLNSLTAGAKYIYIVVKDTAGNVSVPLFMGINDHISPSHGVIQFEASSHGTYEGYNGWMIGVSRTDGSDGEVSISYAMVDGTAKAGTNYQAYSGTLTWADGDSSRKVIMFTSYNDSIYNGYLDLSCVLSNPTGGAVLGEQNPLNIRISDNDSPPTPTGLKATAGNGQVSLSWEPVKDSFSYKVYYSTVNDEFTENNAIEVYEGETCTITGLTNGTTYYFAIQSRHNIFNSELSFSISVTPKTSSSGGGSYTPPKYTVTDANQGTQVGGQTKLSKERAEEGDTVIITVTTDNGYESGKPVVLDRNKKPLAVTDNGDETFSFKMPASGVTVETEFTKIDYFDDVNEDDWFDEASWYCAAHGLMQGTGSRQFDGHMGTNRAMLVTVLYRLSNSTDDLESIFNDVESGKWYSDAIGWAAHNKIVEGYGNGKFGPNDDLTREQMVSVLHRYSMFMKYNTSKLNDLDTFTDDNAISEWALDAMKWAVGNGIVTGMDNDLISPETGATRAQFAAMMQRYATTFVK